MKAFEKVVRPGTIKLDEEETASVYCTIKWTGGDDGKLSITGVVGPTPRGDAKGGAGQIVDSLPELEWARFAFGWDEDTLQRFCEIWDRWHLNDMKAGCEHQRERWDTHKRVEVVTYRLAREHRLAKRRVEKRIKKAFEPVPLGYPFITSDNGVPLAFSPKEKYYQCDDGEAELMAIRDARHDLPEEGDPGYGMYVEESRVSKPVGTIYPHEHPDGLLGKECPVCGYEYGSEWRYETVPEDVLQWLKALPDADHKPAWH